MEQSSYEQNIIVCVSSSFKDIHSKNSQKSSKIQIFQVLAGCPNSATFSHHNRKKSKIPHIPQKSENPQ
jgi:hypothetical protein